MGSEIQACQILMSGGPYPGLCKASLHAPLERGGALVEAAFCCSGTVDAQNPA